MAGRQQDQLISDTLVQMQAAIVALSGQVGAIGGKIDTFIDQLATHDDRTTDLEARTRKVENRQHWYAGAATIIGALVGKYIPGALGHS